MSRYILSRLAERDLDEIWLYIAEDSVEAADKVIEKIRDAMRKLAEMPGMGHRRDEFSADDVRVWSVYSYLIVYRLVPDRPIQVARVINGMRDLSNIPLN